MKTLLNSAILGAVTLLAVCAGVADAQQTNLFPSGTTPNQPYYSISNYYGITAQQVLVGDGIINTTNYYTNAVPTNGTTGVTVPYMGAAKSINVAFSTSIALTNLYGPGTNTTLYVWIDGSTGFGDWVPYVNYSGVVSTNGVGAVGITTNVGAFTLFRINRIGLGAVGYGTAPAPGGTNLCQQYSCKTGL